MMFGIWAWQRGFGWWCGGLVLRIVNFTHLLQILQTLSGHNGKEAYTRRYTVMKVYVTAPYASPVQIARRTPPPSADFGALVDYALHNGEIGQRRTVNRIVFYAACFVMGWYSSFGVFEIFEVSAVVFVDIVEF